MYLTARRLKSRLNFSVELVGKPGQISLTAQEMIMNIIIWFAHFLVVYVVGGSYRIVYFQRLSRVTSVSFPLGSNTIK